MDWGTDWAQDSKQEYKEDIGNYWLELNGGNHWNVDWGQFKDCISHMCLAGTVLASWSLTQEVVGFNAMIAILVIESGEFSEFR